MILTFYCNSLDFFHQKVFQTFPYFFNTSPTYDTKVKQKLLWTLDKCLNITLNWSQIWTSKISKAFSCFIGEKAGKACYKNSSIHWEIIHLWKSLGKKLFYLVMTIFFKKIYGNIFIPAEEKFIFQFCFAGNKVGRSSNCWFLYFIVDNNWFTSNVQYRYSKKLSTHIYIFIFIL